MGKRDGGLPELFRRHLPDIHWQRVELGPLGRGVPDTNFCVDGIEGWMECKAADRNQIQLRPEQIGWMIDRTRHGGLVRIAIRHMEDNLLMYDGRMCDGITTKTFQGNVQHLIKFWSGGVRSWNWEEIKTALITRV